MKKNRINIEIYGKYLQQQYIKEYKKGRLQIMDRKKMEKLRSQAKEMQIRYAPLLGKKATFHANLPQVSRRASAIDNKTSRPTVAMKTGASLIPDLNKLINRAREYPDDRFIYLTYMLSKSSEYFTPYSLM